MEQKSKPSTPEERRSAISDFFEKELKKISGKLEIARALAMGVDTNGAVRRRQQEILHLEQRETELGHDRGFVLEALTESPEAIRYFLLGKIDEIDLESKRIESHPSSLIFDGGPVKGKEQELHHLRTILADTFRVGNHVLGVLGQPPLVDKKNPQPKT